MKTPEQFAALSELNVRAFKLRAVITPKRRFDIYDEGRYCNVTNWSSEYQTHVYHRLSYIGNVDGKPLYFVDTYCSITSDWLCSQSYRTMNEVKNAWRGQL